MTMASNSPNIYTQDPFGRRETALKISNALICVFLGLLLNFVRKGYHARRKIARLRDAGLPVAPGWNYWTGNLLLMGQMGHIVPSRATKVTLFGEIVRMFPKEGCCYLDLWPFSRPFLLIMDPELGVQACETEAIAAEKPLELAEFFVPITGGFNLFDLPGKDWKPWRQVFNKGFSDSTIALMVPGMVEEARKYCVKLAEKAQAGDIFKLDPMTLRYAIDFIGTTALNSRLNSQDGYDRLADSMLSQIRWLPKLQGANPFENVNLVRMFVHWWNGHKMDTYIGRILDERYREHLTAGEQPQSSKSVIDLILKSYISGEYDGVSAQKKDTQKDNTGGAPKMDPTFRAFAIRQIRLFLFVGHDSMSSTLCYALHLLATNPGTLAAIRAEHNRILGTDLASVPDKICASPNLLNSLTYTTAVIKETLRLYPPGSGTRQGSAEVSLRGADGTLIPTESCLVWTLHIAMHRAPEYWHEPEHFMPERWMPVAGGASVEGAAAAIPQQRPRRHAWRAFEWGPRNCIGQNLAITELRISLALLVRVFDVASAYDEWDSLYPPPKGSLMAYRGDRAYQVEEGAAHPADGYPCRAEVTLAGRGFVKSLS